MNIKSVAFGGLSVLLLGMTGREKPEETAFEADSHPQAKSEVQPNAAEPSEELIFRIGDFESAASTPAMTPNSNLSVELVTEPDTGNRAAAVTVRPGVAALTFDLPPGAAERATGVAFSIKGNQPDILFDAALVAQWPDGTLSMMDPNLRATDDAVKLDSDEWQTVYVPLVKFTADSSVMKNLKSVRLYFFPKSASTAPILVDNLKLMRITADDINIIGNYTSAPARLPRLLFSAEELPEIRAKIQRVPALKTMYEKFRAERVSKFMELPDEPYTAYKMKDSKGGIHYNGSGRVLHSHVLGLAVAGLIDKDEACIRKAIKLLVSSAKQEGPSQIFAKQRIALNVGDMSLAYPIAYDWLNTFMTEEERVLVKNRIHEYGAWVYAFSPDSHWGGPPKSEASNWSAVLHAPMGLAALVLDEHPEWRELADRKVSAYLTKSIGPDGAPSESGHYLSLGSASTYPYITALRRLKGEDLLAPHKERLAGIPRYFSEMALPWGGDAFAISQGSAYPDKAGWFISLCSYLKSGLGYWEFYRIYGDKETWGGNGTWAVKQHDVHKADEPFIILAWDKSVAPVSPEKSGLPLSHTFQSGQAVARTGWDDDAAVVHFKSDERMHGWSHADDNTFGFAAYGQSILTDPGAARYYTRMHNAVLIDGKEQAWKNPGHDVHGEITRFEDRGDYVVMTGDATRAYAEFVTDEAHLPVKKVLRTLYFVRNPRPLLLVVDELAMQDGQGHDYALHFQYGWRGQKADLTLDKASLSTIMDPEQTHVRSLTKMLWPTAGVSLRKAPEIKNGIDTVVYQTRAVDPVFVTLVAPGRPGEEAPRASSYGMPDNMRINVHYADGTSFTTKLDPSGLTLIQP